MLRSLAVLVALVALVVGSQAAPATAQAAASTCPPGQPPGRPPGRPPEDPPIHTGRPDYPPGRCQLALSQSSAARGDTFRATGDGFIPGETVTLSIAGINVTTVVADANGTFATDLTVPRNAPLGRTQVLATGAGQQLAAAFEVVPSPAGNAAPRASGALVRTGEDIARLASLGLALLLTGAIIVMVVRRRRAATAAGLLP
jgi:hypothetical protein